MVAQLKPACNQHQKQRAPICRVRNDALLPRTDDTLLTQLIAELLRTTATGECVRFASRAGAMKSGYSLTLDSVSLFDPPVGKPPQNIQQKTIAQHVCAPIWFLISNPMSRISSFSTTLQITDRQTVIISELDVATGKCFRLGLRFHHDSELAQPFAHKPTCYFVSSGTITYSV